MAFQISIGDVLMLSRLAYDIALAFTSGRKSAPAEFREVQNQLYSLSTALDSFKSLATQSEEIADQRPIDGISAIIQNCRITLEHLEQLVKKYMVIQDPDDHSTQRRRQWSAEVLRNWKKVKWTREGGDLAKLQHNLGVHINSLNLAVAVENSDLNQKIHCHVEDVHTKLDEIYGWFTSNLKNRTTNFDVPRQSFTSQEDVSLGPTFSLYMESPNNNNIVPICENACFDPEWLQNSTNQRVFKCQCNSIGTAYGSGHQEHLACYSLSQTSLITRLNGPSQSWKIWLSSARTSKAISLVIQKIQPSQMALLQDTIADLAIHSAQQTIARGLGSLMIFPSVNPHTSRTVLSVLNMTCDTRILYNQIANLRLTTNGHSYSPGPIETVGMAHYRNLTETREWLFSETADMMFYLRPENVLDNSLDDCVERLSFTIDYQTRFTMGENKSTVCIYQTDCISVTESGQESMVKSLDAEMELRDDGAASYFFKQLQCLQQGLLLFKIQEVQRYETLMFQLPLGLLMVYDYHLTDATLRLVFDPETEKYRLLIANGFRSICLSIEVSRESISQIAGTEEPCISLNAPCWIAEADSMATHIFEHQKEPTLTCGDPKIQQLLALKLKPVASGDQRVRLPIPGPRDSDSGMEDAD